ncbi:MAG: molybdate ABC transporter substrate-binding protein, partial [Paracoccaceae bacterium]
MSEAVFSHYISRFFRLIILMISLFFSIGHSESWAQNARPDRLTVFAAASLKPAFKEIVPLFEKEHDIKLVLSFAGSGYGAPADVFVSANDDWMRYLEERGLVQESVTLFSNALVLIESTKYDNARDFAMTRSELLKRLGDGTIALGNVTSVPAGLYAKAAFEFLGLWSDIKSRVAQTD